MFKNYLYHSKNSRFRGSWNLSQFICPTLYRRGGRTDPPWFFANNSRKKRPIATKLSVPSHWSILHLPWKFHDPDPNDLWPVTSFPRPCLAGIAISRMSARTSRVFASFSWFQTFKHVIWCYSRVCQGHLKVRSGHWPLVTSGDLGSLFRVLHVSRLVFGAEFEFSNHMNIYEVVLVPS